MSDLVLTPSAVNKYIKNILEKNQYLRIFKISGEISNYKSSNGNLYFSIKDEEAQISCMTFKNVANFLPFKLEEGMQVEIEGSLYLNIKTGYYSINVKNIKEIGLGNINLEYEKLKAELEKEGYFNQEHKLDIPKFNKKIALVTSPTSAAVKDMIATISRRYPFSEVIIIPTTVQGNKAVGSIINSINLVNDNKLADIMIVGRGGGSIEDLWAFNSKEVALCVYNSEIPIISCVGHETDFTIIDYVSDRRAPTPTAAAEFVTPDIHNLSAIIDNNVISITKIMDHKIKLKQSMILNLQQNQYLKDPIMAKKLIFDGVSNKFDNSVSIYQNKIKYQIDKIVNNKQLIERHVKDKIANKQLKLKHTHELIDNLNPLCLLSRGYSVSYVNDTIIKSIDNIDIDNQIKTQVSDGFIISTVVGKEKNE